MNGSTRAPPLGAGGVRRTWSAGRLTHGDDAPLCCRRRCDATWTRTLRFFVTPTSGKALQSPRAPCARATTSRRVRTPRACRTQRRACGRAVWAVDCAPTCRSYSLAGLGRPPPRPRRGDALPPHHRADPRRRVRPRHRRSMRAPHTRRAPMGPPCQRFSQTLNACSCSALPLAPLGARMHAPSPVL